MRTPQEYLTSILAGTCSLPPTSTPLDSARGCVLAQDVYATDPLPSFDNSAMDGYAVRHRDLVDATDVSPVWLAVIDDIPAGTWPAMEVRSGTAARIMTGAPLPPGADCVVRIEDSDGGFPRVRVHAAVPLGRDIRRVGEDVLSGQQVLATGEVLTARHIALLAAVGQAAVLVHPRPRVAVISTGSELVEPGTPLARGKIRDANGYLLAAAVQDLGAIATRWPAVADSPEALLAALEEAATVSDLILTTGGVSMGVYDTVKTVLSSLGSATFEKVAMQPGMPQGHGRVGLESVPILTLPGNPVSAYVSFEVFVRPYIRRLQGHIASGDPHLTAECGATFASPLGKVHYVRASLTGTTALTAVPVGVQGSHMLGGLAQSNCLMVIPAGTIQVREGDRVEILDLRQQSR